MVSNISKDSQKLIRYFNDTIVSTCFEPSLTISPDSFYLNLNQSLLVLAVKSAIIPVSLLIFQKLLNVFECLLLILSTNNIYRMSLVLSTCTLFVSLIQTLNQLHFYIQFSIAIICRQLHILFWFYMRFYFLFCLHMFLLEDQSLFHVFDDLLKIILNIWCRILYIC